MNTRNLLLWSLRLIILGMAVLPAVALSQTATLDGYVREGWQANLSLKQQQLVIEKSKAETKQAFGLFLPSVTLNVQHLELSGNVLNLGDLINPAFKTLNQLIGQSAFPTNLDLTLPQTRQTTLRVMQPLFQPAILFNYQIHTHLTDAQKAVLQTKARQLAADIQTAYFNYVKTLRVVELYAKTLGLVEENYRVSERLVANQKATAETVYRAKAELSDVQQKKADAEKNNDAAAQYFNFLLNRPLGTPVELVDEAALPASQLPSLDDAQRQARERREEFRQIKSGIEASEKNVSINTAAFLPTLSAAVDYGFQGNTYDFSPGKDYVAVAVMAQWNIFNGFQDNAKRQQAILESSRLKTQYDEAEQQIALQVRQAYNDACVALAAIATANDRLASAKKSFEIVSKKYEQGAASQIEYIDARTTFTNADINQILTRYESYIKVVQFDRAAARYPVSLD
jgi:outer membrane protein TolC